MRLFDQRHAQAVPKARTFVPLLFVAVSSLAALVLFLAWARPDEATFETATARALKAVLGPELPLLARQLTERVRPLVADSLKTASRPSRGNRSDKIGEPIVWSRLFFVDLDTGSVVNAPGFDRSARAEPFAAGLAPLIAHARARLPDVFHERIAEEFPVATCSNGTKADLCFEAASARLVTTDGISYLAVFVPVRLSHASPFMRTGSAKHCAVIGMVSLSAPLLARIAGRSDLGNFELVRTNVRSPRGSTFARRLNVKSEERPADIVSLLASLTAFVAALVAIYATCELAKSESTAIELAGHDRLSGLPNRSLFSQYLDSEIARLARRGGGLALLYLDLDRFKEINDSFGHDAGDRIIVSVGHRIRQILRGSDKVARLGGDEFAILQTDVRSPRDCELLARRVMSTINEPFELDEGLAHTGVSVGIALCPQDAVDRDEVMRRADLALYRAKNSGRNRVAFFESRMGEELRLRERIEDELRQAIDNGALTVLYQPIVTADNQRLVGVEALVRWPHPTHGLVLPDDFIGLAEDRGLILPLGEWVLRRACTDAKNWGDLRISVNVSPIQFRQKHFVATVAKILVETGLDPSRLELELTEGVVVEDADQAENAIIDLRAMGVRLALDDFGIGYSSLIYLRRFAFDKIKIDRSFLQTMEATGESAIIVHSIVHLGRALGLTVTAEGIETPEQHRFLQALGCHELQGFLFSKPVGPEVITRMVASGSVMRRENDHDQLLSGAA